MTSRASARSSIGGEGRVQIVRRLAPRETEAAVRGSGRRGLCPAGAQLRDGCPGSHRRRRDVTAWHDLLEELQPLPGQFRTSDVSPVILPPGRARLATKPAPTGSPMAAMTMGIVAVAALAATRRWRADRDDDHVDLQPNQLRGQHGKPSAASADRHSMTMFCPRHSPGRAALAGRPRPSASRPPGVSRECRSVGTFPACCASAASGAARAPASEVSRKRRRSITRSPDPPAPAATAGS